MTAAQVQAPVLRACCNPRPWHPICVDCPGRCATPFASSRRSGNPYARIDEDPELARPVVTVELPPFEEEK